MKCACGGTILAEVSAVEQNFFLGSWPEIQVFFMCRQCKATNFPGLPSTSDEIDAILTAWVAGFEPKEANQKG